MLTLPPVPRNYGPIRQLAFVPQDFDESLSFWVNMMGVGPFYHLEHIVFESVQYRGQPIDYDSSAAVAFWGDIEIELLRQHNDVPSILNDWPSAGSDALHHIRLQVDDLAAARADFLDRGGSEIQTALLPGGSAYSMIAMPGLGPMIELSWLDPQFESVFAFMKRAAIDWDGSDPLRPISDAMPR